MKNGRKQAKRAGPIVMISAPPERLRLPAQGGPRTLTMSIREKAMCIRFLYSLAFAFIFIHFCSATTYADIQLPLDANECQNIGSTDYTDALSDINLIPFAQGRPQNSQDAAQEFYFTYASGNISPENRNWYISQFALLFSGAGNEEDRQLCASLVGVDFSPSLIPLTLPMEDPQLLAWAGYLGITWPSIPNMSLAESNTIATFHVVSRERFDHLYKEMITLDLGNGDEQIPRGFLNRRFIQILIDAHQERDRPKEEFALNGLRLVSLGLDVGVLQVDRSGNWAVVIFDISEQKSSVWIYGSGFELL